MRCCFFLVGILLSACGGESQPPLVATDVIVTTPMPGTNMSAAYMSLTNNTDRTINISRVVSTQYESVQLHETKIEDGVARMRPLPRLAIPAGATVTLQRGAKHLMLAHTTGLDNTVSLQFLDGADLILTVDATFNSDNN